MEKLKEEDERREARRQARKLNFLIEQTEIFSHFVGQRLDKKQQCKEILSLRFLPPPFFCSSDPASCNDRGCSFPFATVDGVKYAAPAKATADLDFANDDDATLRARAEANANAALIAQKARTAEFDSDRTASRSQIMKMDSNGHIDPIAELDFKQTGNVSSIEAPTMLKGCHERVSAAGTQLAGQPL